VQGGEYKATVSWDVTPYSLTLYPEAESRSFNRKFDVILTVHRR